MKRFKFILQVVGIAILLTGFVAAWPDRLILGSIACQSKLVINTLAPHITLRPKEMLSFAPMTVPLKLQPSAISMTAPFENVARMHL